MSSKRIAPVDGLRAVAVLGVIWAHAWAFSGTPALSIGRVESFSLDIQRLFSMFGTGVDLFFVISGFCMCLMYLRKQTEWSWNVYWAFVKRRWLRLAPAFYVAATVCLIGLWWTGSPLYWRSYLATLSFTHILIPGLKNLASPFWSLATEWHFYLVLPALLWGSVRWSFQRMMGGIILASFCFRIWAYLQPEPWVRFLSIQLPLHLIEFCWGILVAHWVEEKRALPRVLRGNMGFLIGLAVMFAGRLLLTREAAAIAGRWSALPLIAWQPVLSLGYAIMLWNVVASPSFFADMLSSRPAQAIGRWSYSLYLWHWWPCYVITTTVMRHLGPTLLAQYLSLTALLLFLVPWSWLSYQWLEAPYFTRWREKVDPT